MDSLESSLENVPTDGGAPPLPQPRRIKIVRDGILAFVASIVLTVGLVMVAIVAALLTGMVVLGSPEPFTPTPGMMVAVLLASEIPFAAVALFMRWRYRSTGRVLPLLFGGPYLSAIGIGIGAGIVMTGFGVVHALLATSLFGTATTEAMEELMRAVLAAQGNPVALAALGLCIALLAPLCEEFFFRGAMFSSVRSAPSARTAAVVSSLLFAVAHLNPAMFTYYLVFGLTMCWLLWKTQTIAAPIAAHVTVNATATIAMFLGS